MWVRRRRVTELGAWLALVAAVAAAAYVIVRGAGGRTASSTPATGTPAPAPAPKRPPARVSRSSPARSHSGLVIRAARGDCWLEARSLSAAGPVLFRGLLRRGRTARFRAQTIWVEFGAGDSVNVLVNGQRQRIPNGTTARVFHLRS
jgi:hypothetical protein